MNIEIYNNRCPMRCAHCPQAIQNPETSIDRLPDLYAKITKLSGITPILVSLNNDISDVLSEIERFKIHDINELVVGSTRMPISPSQLIEVARHPAVAGKRLHLVHLHKALTYDKDLIEIIVPLFEALTDSSLQTLQIAFNDNAMPLDRYHANKIGILAEDEAFLATFRSICLDETVRGHQKFTIADDAEAYNSSVGFNHGGRYFVFTRRIVSSVQTETPSLNYYGKLARRDVDIGMIFAPDHLDLTITPLGVRISHQTWDIENPYLWFTHDEFEALMRYRDFIDLCNILRAAVNKTLSLDLDGVFNGKLNAESLSAIAAKRKLT